MDNSLVTHLSAYVEAAFKDAEYAYTKSSDWKRDQTRLRHELAIHGTRVLTMDLPALGKHFLRCLDEGLYTPSGLTLGSLQSKRVRVPVLFRNLYLQIFDHEGKLRDTPCVDSIALIHWLHSGLKKLKLECSKRSVDDEVEKFIAIEKEIKLPTYSWSADSLDFSGNRPSYLDGTWGDPRSPWLPGFEPSYPDDFERGCLDSLQQVCDIVSTQFGDLHDEGISEFPKHGPGAVANQTKGTSKYAFRWWTTKLEAVFPYDLYARTDFGLGEDHDREVEWGRSHEHPSRLISVPKTLKAPRLIAAEPVEHQWVQQLVRNQLEARLDQTSIRSCVRFRSQEMNQKLAISGSLNGGVATVDLSSASDRLSCWAVERAFRCNYTILERLHACRTRWLSNEVSNRSERFLSLKKFAPMGSAVTFPVQSIVYACVAVTAVLITKNQKVSSRSIQDASRQVQVFGDDIIIPTSSLGVLVDLLTRLGLRVNVDKSFGNGNFRESCGVDAFSGYDITPGYLTSPSTSVRPSEIGSFVQVSNNLWKKGRWHTADWLRRLLHRYDSKVPVVASTSDAFGWASFCGDRVDHLKSRWNAGLQRQEYQVFVPRGKVPLMPTAGSFNLFQWFIEKPQPDTQWVAGTRGRPTATWRSGWAPEDNFPTLLKGKFGPSEVDDNLSIYRFDGSLIATFAG